MRNFTAPSGTLPSNCAAPWVDGNSSLNKKIDEIVKELGEE